MLMDVTKTFLKFSVTFLLFLFSFAVGFYTLQYDREPVVHANIGRSLAKTMTMMMGDFDFDGMFNGDEKQPLTMWFLFFLFIVTMVILLTNLMVGLAVGDIQAVLDKAVMERITMQVNLILDVEKGFPKCLKRRFLMSEKTVYPNREYKWYTKIMMSHITNMEQIEEAVGLDSKDDDQNDKRVLRESINELKVQSDDLRQQLRKIEGILQKLLKSSKMNDEQVITWC